VSITLFFTNATSTNYGTFSILDWFGGAPFVINNLGRIARQSPITGFSGIPGNAEYTDIIAVQTQSPAVGGIRLSASQSQLVVWGDLSTAPAPSNPAADITHYQLYAGSGQLLRGGTLSGSTMGTRHKHSNSQNPNHQAGFFVRRFK
jgi:hypothetical protein